MFVPKSQDQGTIALSQKDYLPILLDSFLVDRSGSRSVDRDLKLLSQEAELVPCGL